MRALWIKHEREAMRLEPGESATLGDEWQVSFGEDGKSCRFEALTDERLTVPVFWMV